jgi:hypothetical protein
MTSTRNIWSVDLRVWATAYVQADTREEAEALIRSELLGSGLEVKAVYGCDVEISGLPFDHPDMPEVSISPAMSIDDNQEDGWQNDISLHETVELSDDETEDEDEEDEGE